MIRFHFYLSRWLWLTLLVFLADQWTKYWVSVNFGLYDYRPFTSWFGLTLAHNKGAAFSFLNNAGGWQRWMFIGIAVLASIMLIVWIWRSASKERMKAAAIALILGGALGNLVDRIVHGYVIDFLLLHYKSWYFPAFNVADSAISAGVALLVIKLFFGRK